MNTTTSGAADLPEALIGAIMAAAYDFRDAHISGSKNLKRTAHAELESTVRNTLHALAAGQAPKAAPGDAIDEAMRERDDAEDFIDALLDEVLGHERPEWSNLYGRADALNDVQEHMTELHKPAVDKAWGQFQSAMAAPQPVAREPLSEMPYEKRKAIQEGEQIGASDAWFKARHEMLDTVDRRNVFRAGFDRGWNAALDAQGGKDE